ncbi:IucA/IucC family protein [Nocardioides pakistanensis]
MSLVEHLTPERVATAHRGLVRKALAELSHERLLVPQSHGPGMWAVAGADPAVEYTFAARLLPLDHWLVDAGSIRRLERGEETELDIQRFVLDVNDRLGIGAGTLPVYLEELGSTLAGAAYKLRPDAPTAKELVHADFQTVEAAMTEGHPCFVACNGRLGFDADDYLRYAPETGARFRLVWLAVRRAHATVAAARGVEYDALIAAELGAQRLDRFTRRLTGLGLDPTEYVLVPAHPWQWANKLAGVLAGPLARHDVVWLGEGDDEHQAQQSIRTMFNTSRPERPYVKTALSILNMGFMRGLSPQYMGPTPAINDWVADLVAGDETLRRQRFSVLREVAAAGFHHRLYEDVSLSTPYTKMLSALFRESPVDQVEEGERLATMASLLHVDAGGRAVVAELVAQSGLAPDSWLRNYLEAYLVPLLHCFYAHALVFMPHGENVILVLRDHVPVRVLMKDIGEEVAVLDTDAEMPEEIRRVVADVPEDLHVLSLLTDVVDCFLRFLSARFEEAGLLDADRFWQVVAVCVSAYQARHPELAEGFARHDLFVERFPLSCLNRLQLRNNQEMVDIADPASALAIAGELDNPLARAVRARP